MDYDDEPIEPWQAELRELLITMRVKLQASEPGEIERWEAANRGEPGPPIHYHQPTGD